MKKTKKNISFLVVILCTLLFNMKTSSATSTAELTSNKTFRAGPTQHSDKLGVLLSGITATILESNVSGETDSGCLSSWYKIQYQSTVGYICGSGVVVKETVEIDPDGPYETQLAAAGFPETYWPYLKALHLKYPNWAFTTKNTGLNFNDVVSNQSSLGKSLIQTTNDGWKHIDSYNYLTNAFNNNYKGGGPTWYAASPEIIKYYLDPRNFLNESNIFMFELLSFNSNYHNLGGVTSILNSTFMNGIANRTAEDSTRNLTYPQIFMEAANESKASPYFLSARVIQEVTPARTTIVSGTFRGYEGYYNFYNIGATGSSIHDEIIANGLNRAKTAGWDSEYDAIVGGAKWISSEYINIGQDSLYTQKWDIIGPNFYSHQYMQNIQAPASESVKIYNIYNGITYLNGNFVFSIPVYNYMPSSTSLPNTGNPNNFLKSLKVNETPVVGFDSTNTEYTVYVSENATSVDIQAEAIVNNANISGQGNVILSEGTTAKNIVVTAQNGETKTYKINIVKSSTTSASVGEIMENISVKYNDNYISGINIGTNVNTLIQKVKEYNAGASITIQDSNGNLKSGVQFGTGDSVTINSGNETKKYSVIIYGDTNGDGVVTILDLLRVQKLILNTITLSPTYSEAADVNKDSSVTILDLLKVQKHILGSIEISQ